MSPRTIIAIVLTSAMTILSSMSMAGEQTDEQPKMSPEASSKIHVELGVNYFMSKRYDIALDEARKAIELNPKSVHGHNLMGSVYFEMQDVQRAEASFRQALSVDSHDADALSNMGMLLCQSGKQKEALDYFAKSLASPTQTKMAATLVNTGICIERTGDPSGAEKYYSKSLEIEPGNLLGQWNLARLAFNEGKIEEAKSRILSMHRNMAPNKSTLWLLTIIARKQNDRKEYERYGSQLVEQFPKSREVEMLYNRDFRLP